MHCRSFSLLTFQGTSKISVNFDKLRIVLITIMIISFPIGWPLLNRYFCMGGQFSMGKGQKLGSLRLLSLDTSAELEIKCCICCDQLLVH